MTTTNSIRFEPNRPAAAAGAANAEVWYRSGDGSLRAGYWSAGVGHSIELENHFSEFCTLLDGVVRVTDRLGRSEVYRRGDSFVIPAGFGGRWETVETCRKFFVIHEPTGQ